MPAGSIGICVVGSGHWGGNYVRLFQSLPDAHVVVVCDANAERLEAVTRQFPGVEVRTSLEEALALPGVDAAVVSTPAATHAAVTETCLRAGKHVLVEKPLTTTVTDGHAVVALAEELGLTLMVGHTFLYNGSVAKVRELVQKPEMGEIYYLYSRRTNLGPIRHDVNAIWDLACHDVAIFAHILGDTPEWASAVGTRLLGNAREDVGFIALGYPGGVVGHIHVSWADPNKVRELVVVGSGRRVVLNDMDAQEPVRVFDKGVVSEPIDNPTSGDFRFTVRDGDIFSPRVVPSEPLGNQARHFLESVRTGSRPLTDGPAGLDVVSVMEAIDRSLAAGGAPSPVQATKRSSHALNGNGNGNGSHGDQRRGRDRRAGVRIPRPVEILGEAR
ncbi:MAG: Oxidoreductase, C-terminal [uncultured Thermoleophilia bacterium]|uniref:Oxidoreductase, C-terminal n=1 Tax=uncultured Thermoleophilia bacterium TaxID=1497501 RepID=A0A6J4UMS6_9ACTN|nr:MAG: Oxidoreductase, C-terminal [uncultured Thermoleophilia bacterium]